MPESVSENRSISPSTSRADRKTPKDLGINISRAAEAGIAKAVAAEKTRRWKIENREAIESSGMSMSRSNGTAVGKVPPVLMARYDVFPECRTRQAICSMSSPTFLNDLNTRVVVPLAAAAAKTPVPMPQAKSDLRDRRPKMMSWSHSCMSAVAGLPNCRDAERNLSKHHDHIVAALDMLFQGF